MLKANVGLSRKITRDYNSTGYSVNVEGEISFTPDDSQGVLEKVKELFSLAQEALAVEIDRDQGDDAIGRRDEERPAPRPETNGTGSGQADRPNNGSAPRSAPTGGNGQANQPANEPAPPRSAPTNGNGAANRQNGNSDQATNKQIQFLLTMGKRFKLSTPQLEARVAQLIGRRCGVYELSKKEAGLVLDQLTKSANGNGNGTGQQGR